MIDRNMTPEATPRTLVVDRQCLNLFTLDLDGDLTITEQPSGNLYAVRSARYPSLTNVEHYFGRALPKKSFTDMVLRFCLEEIRQMVGTTDFDARYAKQFEDGLVQIACFGYDSITGLNFGLYGHLLSERQKPVQTPIPTEDTSGRYRRENVGDILFNHALARRG